MKVAIDVVPIRNTGEMGGAFHLVVELIKGLAVSNKSDNYYLLTAEWNHEFFGRFEQYGVERICVQGTIQNSKVSYNKTLFFKILRKLQKIFKFKIKKRTKSILRSRDIDVLFCPMSAINFAEPGIPTLSLIYDLHHEYYPQFFSEEEIFHRKKFYDGICELADQTVSISNFTKNTLVDLLKYPEDNAKVIYISIQDRIKNINDEQKNEILKKFNLKTKNYIYYPANFWPHKNHRMLFVALSMFKNKYPQLDIHLCLTGSLLDKEVEFKEMIHQMNIENNVSHLGYVSELEVSALMAEASFLIFPSLFEGFGIPVAEAMSVGTPVLCSDNTSLPEVGGKAALYFDPRRPAEIADKMYDIITNLELREKTIEIGFKQVEQFKSDVMIKQYYELLQQVSQMSSAKGYSIKGLFGDSWTEPEVLITIGKETKERERIISLEMLLPPVSPYKNCVVNIAINDTNKKINLISGQPVVINENIPMKSCDLTIEIESTFTPEQIGIPDSRELGIQLLNLDIQDKATGTSIKTLHKAV